MKDFTHDPVLKHFHQAEMHHPFPDWVASSPIPTKEEVEKNASAAFADSENRRLPIHSAVATFHSALDIMAHAADYKPETFDRVKRACAIFGILDDIEPYVEFYAQKLEKTASAPVAEFAVEEQFDNRDYRLFPLQTEYQVKDASYRLVTMAHENRLPYPMFYKAACRVYRAADRFNALDDIHPVVFEAGVERVMDRDKTMEKLAGRERHATKGDQLRLQAAYDEVLEANLPVDEMIMKIAAIDIVAGITPKFRTAIPLPAPHTIVKTGPLLSDIEKQAREHIVVDDILVPRWAVVNIAFPVARHALSKEAFETFRQTAHNQDGKDLSLAILDWDAGDKRQLLSLALKSL